jgi:hypothetical protein
MNGVTRILLLLVALLSAGCASQTVVPATQEAVVIDPTSVQTMTEAGVTVQVAIPSEEQVARIFGVPLAEQSVQPIWIRIVNTTDVPYWLLPIAIDPDYFTADEATLATTGHLDDESTERVREAFRRNAMPFYLGGNSVNEGYVYASHRRGGRFVEVRVAAPGHALRMRFAVLLPTEGFDYVQSPLRQLYAKVDSFPDLTLDEARVRIRELPCCTTNADGTGQGDPLNIVIVGDGEDVLAAMTASGWTFTEAITVDSVRRMIGAAIADKEMLQAPVSALYAFGRKQDIALQRGRLHIAQRNHIRFWLAPFRCEGLPVWVGQVSRDIGVKATSKSPTLTTHIIDPNVDESRQFVMQSLLYQEAVKWFAIVRGVGAAPRDQPRHNLTDDPYFTDGMRIVIGISDTPIANSDVYDLGWNESTDPIRAGKGEDAKVPLRKP